MAPIFVASSILSPKLSTHHMSTEEFPGILFNPREALREREHHPPSKEKGKHTGALSLKDLHSFGLMFSFHIFFIVFGVFQWLINGHYPLSLSIDSIESLDSTSFYIYRIHRLHHSSAHTHTKILPNLPKATNVQHSSSHHSVSKKNTYCCWFRNPAEKPVEVGSWNALPRFYIYILFGR